MSYLIVKAQCTACSACEAQCPNEAISFKGEAYKIDPAKCTECIGFFDEAQCAAVCPVDMTCIVDVTRPRYQVAA